MFTRRGLFSRLLGGAAAAVAAKVAPKEPPIYDFSSCISRPESLVPLTSHQKHTIGERGREAFVPLTAGKSSPITHRCRFEFGSSECECGAEISEFHGCDKTLADCIARGSGVRFAGFSPHGQLMVYSD